MGIFGDIWDGVKSVVGVAVNNSPVGVIVKTATGDTLTKTGSKAIDLGLKTKGGASIAKAVGNDGGSVLGGLRKSLDGGGRVATVLGGGDHTHNKPHRDKDGNKVTPLHDEADKDKEKDNAPTPAPSGSQSAQYAEKRQVIKEMKKYDKYATPTMETPILVLRKMLDALKVTYNRRKNKVFGIEGKYKKLHDFTDPKNPAFDFKKVYTARKNIPTYEMNNYKKLAGSKQIGDWQKLYITMAAEIKEMEQFKVNYDRKNNWVQDYMVVQASFPRKVKTTSKQLMRMSDKDVEGYLKKIQLEKNDYREEQDRVNEVKRKKKLTEDLVEDVRNRDTYPPLSRWYKDYFKDTSLEKYTETKAGELEWGKFAKAKNTTKEKLLIKYKKNLLSLYLEQAITPFLKKNSKGRFTDGDSSNFTPKMMKLVEQVRQRKRNNIGFFQLFFPPLNRTKQKSVFQDKQKDKEDKIKKALGTGAEIVASNPNSPPPKPYFWFHDDRFYISPEKLVPSRYYTMDSIIANLSYTKPSRRPNMLFTYKNKKKIDKDDSVVPSVMRNDVVVYARGNMAYIGFKGSSKLYDWKDNFINSLGGYKATDLYVLHKKIIDDVKKKYPTARIRLVGHSRGGFYATAMAEEYKLSGSSFTGATTNLLTGFSQNTKGFNFYVSNRFDVVSELRKGDNKNNVYTIANIDGVDSHSILNYVPRAYWSNADIKAKELSVQKKYKTFTDRKESVLSKAEKTAVGKTAKLMAKQFVMGSLLATITGGASLAGVGAEKIAVSAMIYEQARKEINDKESASP